MSKEKSNEFNFSKENTKKEKKQVKSGFGKVIVVPFIVAVLRNFTSIIFSRFSTS